MKNKRHALVWRMLLSGGLRSAAVFKPKNYAGHPRPLVLKALERKFKFLT
jgi:hypothetical protein